METYLVHHGVLGQKWGVRHYQNPDGTLKGPKAREHMVANNKKNQTKDEKQKITKASGTYGSGDVKYNKTLIEKTNKKSNKSKTDLDKEIEEWEFSNDYSRKFDSVGTEFVRKYRKEGEEAANKFLDSELKDYTYSMLLTSDEYKDGEKYVHFQLEVSTNKTTYSTYGTEDYTDEQNFVTKKQQTQWKKEQEKEEKRRNSKKYKEKVEKAQEKADEYSKLEKKYYDEINKLESQYNVNHWSNDRKNNKNREKMYKENPKFKELENEYYNMQSYMEYGGFEKDFGDVSYDVEWYRYS